MISIHRQCEWTMLPSFHAHCISWLRSSSFELDRMELFQNCMFPNWPKIKPKLYVIDLPKPNVIWSVCVVVLGMCISSTLMGYNAFAAALIPSAMLCAPSCNIFHQFGGSTVTDWAFSWRAVSSAWVSKRNSEQEH